jgi:HK97 family phage prohead protease
MTTIAKAVMPFDVKATDDSARTVTGLAAAWSLDFGGDVILKGAFKRTLDAWRGSKRTRPVHLIDQHSYHTVSSVLGKMLEAEETDDGLSATFDFVPDDPAADAAYKRVKGGYVTGFSIGYEPVRWEYQAKEGGESWERTRILSEVRLLEVSLVIWPKNDDARVQDIKSLTAALKAGRLSDDDKAAIRALLDAPPAGTPPDAAPPAPDAAKEFAPEAQEALRQQLLRLKLARLVTRAA